MSRRLAVGALVAFLISAHLSSAHGAGVDAALCPDKRPHDTSRLAVPGDFVLSVCFAENALYVKNDSNLMVALNVSPLTAPIERVPPTPPPPLQSLIISDSNPTEVLAPGLVLKVPFGPGAAKLRVTGTNQQSRYLILALVIGLVPGAGDINGLLEMLAELDAETRQAAKCYAENNAIGDVACRLDYEWEVTKTLTRFGIRALTENFSAVVGALSRLVLEIGDHAVDDLDDVEQLLVGSRELDIAPVSPASLDWRTMPYEVGCPGIAPTPVRVDVRNGRGRAPRSGDREALEVAVAAVEIGQVTNEPQPNAAVLLVCRPEQGGPNLFTTEVQIFRGGAELVARLVPPMRHTSAHSFDPRFNGEPVEIREGLLRTGTDYWVGPDAHCCPSVQEMITWRWDGQQFLAEAAPASPTSPVKTKTEDGQPLPSVVLAKARAIYDAARARDFDRLAELGAADEHFTYSFGDSGDAIGSWRRSPQVLDEMVRVLKEPVALDRQSDTPYYWWPASWVHADLPDPRAVDYRLGITEGGKWEFFVAGD